MGRNRNDAQLDQVRQLVQQHPNQKAAWLARQVGCDNKAIQRLITQLEERGDLLYEDERGGLNWFGRQK